MELRILSRDAAEQYQPQGVEICISITDPAASPAELSPAFAAVLRLAFSDIVAKETPEDVLFAPDHAAAVVGFMERWRHADRLVVHCHAGVSRSPGMALGLCDRFGWPAAALEESYPFWNRCVREVLVSYPGSRAVADRAIPVAPRGREA
jgi:predicted protein tyrosine phosphatase